MVLIILMNVKDKYYPVVFKSIDFDLDKNNSIVIGNILITDLLSGPGNVCWPV